MMEKYLEIPFDDIELQDLVGGGRFGSVYKAKWHDKIVAVKKILCFTHEAALLASLRHKNIITFYGACTFAPNSFLVTEYAEHGSLYHFLEDVEKLEVFLIKDWLLDIAKGLRYLHDEAPKRIIHRDLKSLNVLVCEGNDTYILKICDFGSSRQINRDTMSVTSAGTVGWMAPEVIRNEHITEKCDVWSFGVIAWELVTLEIPYAGLEPYSVLWLVAKHKMRLPIPSSCPQRLAELMSLCMSHQPDERPSFNTIVQAIMELSDDDHTLKDLDEFMHKKGDWLTEVAKITQRFSQLEVESAVIASQRAELEHREAQLRLREQALELQLHSDKFFGNHAPVPNTPHADTVLSRFSEKYTVACKWTVDDVIAWVSVLPDGLSKYTAIFREHEISGDVLINLTDEALEQKLNIKPYGHRQKLLSFVRNIQRSTEFPPLNVVDVSNTASFPETSMISIDFIESYRLLSEANQFLFLIRPKDESHFEFIQHVEFVLTCPEQLENDVAVKTKYPFQYQGEILKGHNVRLMYKISYKSKLFRRATTKRVFHVDNNQRLDYFSVNLASRCAQLQPMAPRFQTTSSRLSSSTSQQSLGSVTLSRQSSQSFTFIPNGAVPVNTSPRLSQPMTLCNQNPWFNPNIRKLASPRKQRSISVGSNWVSQPGPGPGPQYQPVARCYAETQPPTNQRKANSQREAWGSECSGNSSKPPHNPNVGRKKVTKHRNDSPNISRENQPDVTRKKLLAASDTNYSTSYTPTSHQPSQKRSVFCQQKESEGAAQRGKSTYFHRNTSQEDGRWEKVVRKSKVKHKSGAQRGKKV